MDLDSNWSVLCVCNCIIYFFAVEGVEVLEVVMSWVVFLVVDGSSIYIDSSRDS